MDGHRPAPEWWRRCHPGGVEVPTVAWNTAEHMRVPLCGAQTSASVLGTGPSLITLYWLRQVDLTCPTG